MEKFKSRQREYTYRRLKVGVFWRELGEVRRQTAQGGWNDGRARFIVGC